MAALAMVDTVFPHRGNLSFELRELTDKFLVIEDARATTCEEWQTVLVNCRTVPFGMPIKNPI